MTSPGEQVVTTTLDAATWETTIASCAQEAARALARLFVGATTTATSVETTTLAALASRCSGRAVAVSFSVSGGTRGTFALLFTEEHADALAAVLVGRGGSGLSARQLDALQEVGNIGVSAFLNAWARQLGKACLPSVPALSYGEPLVALGDAFAGHADLRVVQLSFEPPHIDVALIVAR